MDCTRIGAYCCALLAIATTASAQDFGGAYSTATTRRGDLASPSVSMGTPAGSYYSPPQAAQPGLLAPSALGHHGAMPHAATPVPAGNCSTGNCGGTPSYAAGSLLFEDESCGSAAGGGRFDALRGRFYAGADYIHWWTNGFWTPALVTTSPPGTPLAGAGVLPEPGTTVLWGNSRLNRDHAPGGRFWTGMYLDNCGRDAVEFDFFFMDDVQDFYSISSTGTPIIARPYFDIAANFPGAGQIAFPGEVVGGMNVQSSTSFHSAGVAWRHTLCCNVNAGCGPSCGSCGGGCGDAGCGSLCGDGCYTEPVSDRWSRTDLLVGYRYFNVDESLLVQHDLTLLVPSAIAVAGTNFATYDYFRTENDFHGFELGYESQWGWCRWALSMQAKLAIGNMRQRAHIRGATTVSEPGFAPVGFNTGLLALPSNAGNYDRNRFSMIPQLALKAHYCLNDNWRVNLGYNVLYVPEVMRPGGLVDLNVDINQLPLALTPGYFPAYKPHTEALWAHGISAGLEFAF